MLPFRPDQPTPGVGTINTIKVQPFSNSANFAGISTGTFQKYWWIIAIAAFGLGYLVSKKGKL